MWQVSFYELPTKQDLSSHGNQVQAFSAYLYSIAGDTSHTRWSSASHCHQVQGWKGVQGWVLVVDVVPALQLRYHVLLMQYFIEGNFCKKGEKPLTLRCSPWQGTASVSEELCSPLPLSSCCSDSFIPRPCSRSSVWTTTASPELTWS